MVKFLNYQEAKIIEYQKSCVAKFPMLDYVSYLQSTLLKTLKATHETTLSAI